MTMITPSYLGETIEYSSLHACRSTLEDPTYEHCSVSSFFDHASRRCAGGCALCSCATVPASPKQGSQSLATLGAEQTAHILGFDPLLERFSALRAQRACGSPATLEELTTRQQLLEAIQTASLDVDGVLGEISNEEGELSNLRTSLQTRRDSTVAKLNAIALITGAGAGAAVSATQFSFAGKTANNVGDGVGIATGAASTLFSFMAIRRQRGRAGQ